MENVAQYRYIIHRLLEEYRASDIVLAFNPPDLRHEIPAFAVA